MSKYIKGGSWYSIPQNARSAERYVIYTTFRDFNIGFRLVKDKPAIKTCPFCGGASHCVEFDYEYNIYCYECGATGPIMYPGTSTLIVEEEDQINIWNKRVKNA